MENSSRKPKIRFKGFNDDWEQRKAKELCLISTGKSNTQDKNDEGKFPFYVRSETIEHSNKYLYDEEAVLTVGDGVGTGKVFHYVNGKYDLHQRVYRCFSFNKSINAKYFYYYFSNNFYNRVMSMTAKTSVDSVRYEMISEMIFSIPKIDEQRKISLLFSNLDNLITLHQRKYSKELQTWEQRKLNDFGIATGGTSIESEFSNNGKYKVISIGSYSENSNYNDQGIRAIYSDKTKPRVLNKEDLTMILNDKTASGRIIGRVLYIDKSGEYVYNQRTERIEINKELYNSRFIYHLLNAPEMRNKIIKQSQGNTQIFVNWNSIKNTEYLVPNLNEQNQLEKIFDSIDNLITLHQHQ